MRRRATIGLAVGLLALGALGTAAEKVSFEAAKEQALRLHEALISYAAPPVRAKIAASARAAREYLAKCGRTCDLHAFLARDLKQRFAGTSGQQARLLETLVFAEAWKDMRQVDRMALQDAQQKQQQLLQTISNISKNEHDTLKAIIQNLRG